MLHPRRAKWATAANPPMHLIGQAPSLRGSLRAGVLVRSTRSGCWRGRVRAGSAGCLAEREDVGLDAGGEEHDLECAVGDRASLANQLIQPLLGHRPVALFANVEPMSVA